MKIYKNFKLVLVAIIILLIGSLFYYRGKNLNSPIENNQVNDSAATEDPSGGQEKNGRYIGYIRDVSVSNGNYSLTIDYIQWLDCDDCPNPFKILNTNPKLRTFPISEGAVVRIRAFGGPDSSAPSDLNWNGIVSLPQFKGLIDGTIIPPIFLEPYNEFGSRLDASDYTNWYKTNSFSDAGIPFWITLNDGVITEISQQYVP